MKKIGIAFFLISMMSLNVMAADYTCTARIDIFKQAELVVGASGIGSATIDQFLFSSMEDGSGNLILTISGKTPAVDLDQQAMTTTFIPQPNNPSSLILRVKDKDVVINCAYIKQL